MKTQIKNWKKNISIAALATTGLMASAAAMANDTPVSFAEQREAQMQVTRDRSRQILSELNRVSDGASIYPQDYVVASRQLLQTVESALTQLDGEIFYLLSRFEAPIARYNEIASSDQINDHQKGLLLQSVNQEIARLKVQASNDYRDAIKRAYDLVPGLPAQAEGSIQVSNATRAQKTEFGCSQDTRHIFKAVFKRVSGEEVLTAYQCVSDSETRQSYPFRAPISNQVMATFKERVLLPLLSQSCQTEDCKTFLSMDYANVFQQLAEKTDLPQTINFGRGSFQDSIPLANPNISTWLVGASLVLTTLPEGCQQPSLAMPSRLPTNGETVERFRSRADLLVRGSAHLFHFFPVFGEVFYNVYGGVPERPSSRNSEEWREKQVERTMARCEETLDSEYGGDRDRYSCVGDGWIQSGPREQMHRERFKVRLMRHEPINASNYSNSGNYRDFFAKQLEASRACLAHD